MSLQTSPSHPRSRIRSRILVPLIAGGAIVAAIQQDLPPALMWDVIGGSVLLSIVIGLVFGLQPAWKAANVDPIEALRA